MSFKNWDILQEDSVSFQTASSWTRTLANPRKASILGKFVFCLILAMVVALVCGCATQQEANTYIEVDSISGAEDFEYSEEDMYSEEDSPVDEIVIQAPSAEEIRANLNISEDYRSSFVHGSKSAEYQKYIVLHDTEGDSNASSVVNWWDSNGNMVAAHFVINKDGSIVQCAPLDSIVHHAGFGDTGHNLLYGVEDESRDDKLGTSPIGSWASDYGMNSYSIGIEMVHVGGSGDYPQAQLEALDDLIAYIDAYYGFESTIIDHKDWRTGNSDTSKEFLPYLENYKAYRTHDGVENVY